MTHTHRAAAVLAILVSLFLFAIPARADQSADLALDKPAFASSSEIHDQVDNVPANANDGDDTTRWCASSPDTPQWWAVDLQHPADLSGLRIMWEKPNTNYRYLVEGSADGRAWTTLSDQTNTDRTEQVQELHFSAPGIRFVRIRITGLEQYIWASMFDVKVFGTPSSQAPATDVLAPGDWPAQLTMDYLPPKNFPHPDRIRYDGHCLTIDGRDTFIFSGAFHYFRCPRELWADRFEKIKEAHFNAIETYVPWNYSEQVEPKDTSDFSQVHLDDFRDWLKMAIDQYHFYVIVRPGPYICSEWTGGGFPRWLLALKEGDGLWLRGKQPKYLAWSKHWLDAVCNVVAPEQITRKPPGSAGVILFQIENEYDLYGEPSRVERLAQLHSLYEDTVGDGIDIPIFTCWTRQGRGSTDPELSQVFDASNLYPKHNLKDADNAIANALRQQPNGPVMISELQGGWFSGPDTPLSEDQPGTEPDQENALTMTCIRDGATITNYYMLFGGTNFGGWAGRGITTTYDYNAPIREPGGRTEKYRVVQAIGEMLQQWGPELARSQRFAIRNLDVPNVDISARRAADGALFIFASRGFGPSRSGAVMISLADGTNLDIAYDLTKCNFQVARLAPGQTQITAADWLPRIIPEPARPPVPDPVVIQNVVRIDDPLPLQFQPIADGQSLDSYGIEEARYVLYKATPSLTPAQAAEPDATLRLRLQINDPVVLDINGTIVTPPVSRRAGGRATIVKLGGMLHAGANSIVVLYDDQGTPNFGPGIESTFGIRSAVLDLSAGGQQIPIQWTFADHLFGFDQQWQADQVDTSNWQGISVGAITKDSATISLVTWYRANFTLPTPNPHVWVPWNAHIEMDGNAYLYLNGHELGRYWDTGPQHDFFLPECWLRFGPDQTNDLTLVVRPTPHGERLTGLRIQPYARYAEAR